MSKSIIFLDVDGVLNSLKTGWYSWDMYVINWLIWLTNISNSKIVVSSTWRKSHDRKFFTDVFGEELIHLDWKTPDNNTIEIEEKYRTRGNEIKTWLDKHTEVERYIILDDDTDFLEEQKPFHIHTDSNEGMLFKDMYDAQELFKIKKWMSNKEIKHKHPIMFGEKWYNEVYRKSEK